MPLGTTLERTPPPFFRQGPSAATRLAFFAALALFLMVADARYAVVMPLRQALAAVLLPLQSLAVLPGQWLRGGAGYLDGLAAAQQGERERARRWCGRRARRCAPASSSATTRACARCSTSARRSRRVRSPPRCCMRPLIASHKWVINRGSRQGVALGSPVINGAGVLGQVTRLYGATAEVTLLTDKDAAIPVLNARTSQRAAAFGNAGPLMELRFTSANSDVRPGDALVTSGLDGVYPAGLPVATVNTVDRRAEAGFARIMLTPAATPDGVRFDARAGAGRRAAPGTAAGPGGRSGRPRCPRSTRRGQPRPGVRSRAPAP
ncbi:MAG: rod shape-determining protein MreC [Rubrivivax sp.]